MDQKDWEATGGVFCPVCHCETVRLIEGRCPSCHEKKSYEEARAMEHIAMALTYWARPRRKPINASSSRRSP